MQQSLLQERKRLKIAVAGSGIAGMSAAWLLNKNHDVTVFEKLTRLGGHSNTVNIPATKKAQAVDTGFIVYNELNYPNFVQLMRYLQVDTHPAPMSFSVSLNDGKFEFGSKNVKSFFGQRRNLFHSRFWKLLYDINKFFNAARSFNETQGNDTRITLEEFLDRGNYGDFFKNRFILPMGAAIWSTRSDKIGKQPAKSFLNFFDSHGLLRFNNPIQWRTIIGGSRNYVRKLTADYQDRIHVGKEIEFVLRENNGVTVVTKSREKEVFDHIVIATHADEALAILENPNSLECRLLGAFKYSKSKVLLHSDESLMPKRRGVWSSWNFLGSGPTGVNVTYWMNLLQSISNVQSYFVSVNPMWDPKPELTFQSFQYEHPLFDEESWRAQKDLWKLQGNRNTWFCGSYFGYGFHEDALQSGLAVAEELGGERRPWKVKMEPSRIFVTTKEKAASD